MPVELLSPTAEETIDLTVLPEPISDWKFGEPLDLLVAEDDRHDQLLLTLASADASPLYRVTFVDNGAQLLAVLMRRVDEGNPPDLVLLDIRMPRLDGHAVLAEMQCTPELCDVPVVVLSSSRAREDVVRCYARGVRAYEVKPSRFDELVEIFDRLPGLLT